MNRKQKIKIITAILLGYSTIEDLIPKKTSISVGMEGNETKFYIGEKEVSKSAFITYEEAHPRLLKKQVVIENEL